MMITSSSEYAITKPGMPPHLSRKREKPLRTYGQKCTPTPEPRGEPPSKKTRRGPESHGILSTRSSIPGKTDTTVEGPVSPLPGTNKEENAPRSSILKYFKPLPAAPRPQPSARAEADGVLLPAPSTTPTPSARARRRPRLLKIRGTLLASDMSSDDASSPSSRHKDEPENTASSPDDKKKNSRDGQETQRKHTGADGTPRRDRTKNPPSVQTTLNISPCAAFAECKLCDMVWNPLCPDDVACHDKRHRSVLGKKRKREEEQL